MKKKEWTRKRILSDAKAKGVRYVRLMMTDLLGEVKNVEVPIYQLDKALDGEIAFDGSSISGFASIEASDMYLVPDLSTWMTLDWEQAGEEKMACMICNIETSDRQSFSGDPRANLIRLLDQLEEKSFTSFNLGAEPEFYLFKRSDNGEASQELADQGNYFQLAPREVEELCRREMVEELEKLGFEIEASHHEVGPGQHEINWRYASALQACDQIQLFKMVVKMVASRYDLYASFMPKPVNGIAGSGMHFNLSLFNEEGNAFYEPSDARQLSQDAYYFIGGLLTYAPAYTAVSNPTTNSYKRLVPGHEAPVYIAWDEENRTPLIRIPASRKQATRLELRSVDPSANPYLALAAVLTAGLKGIENQLDPGKAEESNLFEASAKDLEEKGIQALPESLYAALENFYQEEVMVEALGEHLHQQFYQIKLDEWNRYKMYVSPWEVEEYFNRC